MLDFFNRIGEIIDQIVDFATSTFQTVQEGISTLTAFFTQIVSFLSAFPILITTLGTLLGLLLTWIILSIVRDFF